MTHSTQPRTWVRVVNGLVAFAFAGAVLTASWSLVRLFDLSRADIGVRGAWVEGYAKRIASVTPGGAADRAGLKAGDVLEFDPRRPDDWVLAGYRSMPVGFTGVLPVRHADGTRMLAALAPQRVAFMPTLGDRAALLARLLAVTLMLVLGAFLVSMRPCLMTWCVLLFFCSTFPAAPWSINWSAYWASGPEVDPLNALPYLLVGFAVAAIPFALSFPRETLPQWAPWKRFLLLAAIAALAVLLARRSMESAMVVPFVADVSAGHFRAVFTTIMVTSTISVLLLAKTYRGAVPEVRARVKFAVLGIASSIVAWIVAILIGAMPLLFRPMTIAPLTPANWLLAASGVIYSLSLGYAVVRARVVDVQFAISRTVVYGIVSTIVLVFLAALHWLLGRVLEHSGLAFGLEGLAAIGLGLVLHRASHGINTVVDRVLFRAHHAAEERLRQVTAALPYASTEQSIAEAVVVEPTRHLELASAALFYRETAEGPLRRVLAAGWGDEHAQSLDPESLLVRYLHAEHAALRLDSEQQWLPGGVPEGSARPVLAVPMVTHHVLTAVVLYGAHVNSTLPDPDEVTLLEALARAAAVSHQHVRIAALLREKAAAEREAEARQVRIDEQQKRIDDLESAGAQLRAMLGAQLAAAGK